MVDFGPRFTEVVYFDIECYVPPAGREQSKSSLIFNPAASGHFVLGGVFCRAFPLQNKIEQAKQIWNWKIEEEKATLQQIYDYFTESWSLIRGKTTNHPDLILVGTGISRLDVPTLYVRSVLHRIDSDAALYETYFKTKIVDLGDVGIPLFQNRPGIYPIYPKTTNALISRLNIKTHKTSGKSVWDLYEAREFDAIKNRTAGEVADVMEIASKIASRDF